jgi:hypothetical protein
MFGARSKASKKDEPTTAPMSLITNAARSSRFCEVARPSLQPFQAVL